MEAGNNKDTAGTFKKAFGRRRFKPYFVESFWCVTLGMRRWIYGEIRDFINSKEALHYCDCIKAKRSTDSYKLSTVPLIGSVEFKNSNFGDKTL